MPSPNYTDWSATCDTLHAHTQVLGKLAAALAPPEPGFQHIALQLTARGWETRPLPVPGGGGMLGVGLDLGAHEAFVEHSGGEIRRIPLAPDRPVAEVCGAVLAAVASLAGQTVRIDPTPQEVSWTVALDEDEEHRTYDPDPVRAYFAAATTAAIGLAAFRAPYPGRSTPVNAWWGSFDLAVNLFLDGGADGPDVEEVAVGWWPGGPGHGTSALYAYARPAPAGFTDGLRSPEAARWDGELGEYLLAWDDVLAAPDPRAAIVDFGRSAFFAACGRELA